jgi:hypothetical protein
VVRESRNPLVLGHAYSVLTPLLYRTYPEVKPLKPLFMTIAHLTFKQSSIPMAVALAAPPYPSTQAVTVRGKNHNQTTLQARTNALVDTLLVHSFLLALDRF